MKAACQTLIFGPNYDNTETMLDIIRREGFLGVELAQPTARLCGGDAQALKRLLGIEPRLTLLGLSGGPLKERAEFLRAMAYEKDGWRPYLYCDDVGADEQDAMRGGLRIALHPHAYKKVHSMADVKTILAKAGNENVLLIPDTAHMHIVGDSAEAAISTYKGRLGSVHIKDWTSIYGRVSHRYAKGFTELGRGDVELDKVVGFLKTFDGGRCWTGDNPLWAVFEQDYTRSSPKQSLAASAAWMRERGFEMGPRDVTSAQMRWPLPGKPSREPEAEAQLVRALGAASAGEYAEFFRKLANELGTIFQASLVLLATHDTSHDSYGVLAAWPDGALEAVQQVEADPLLTGEPASTGPQPLSSFTGRLGKQSDIVRQAIGKGATRYLSAPVLNQFNPHHIRFILHVFAPDAISDDPLTQIDFDALAAHIGRAADACLDEYCRETAAMVMTPTNKHSSEDSAKSLFARMHSLIHERVQAGACTILRYDSTTDQLVVVAQDKLKWCDGTEAYPAHGDSLTAKAWDQRLPQIMPDVAKYQDANRNWRPRSEERLKGEENGADLKGRSLMFVPIVPPYGMSLGVVRCIKRANGRPFSDDDVAIVDAMVQAAIPQLRLFEESRQREENYAQLRHELKGPIGAVRNLFDTLQDIAPQWEKSGGNATLTYDIVGDGLRFSNLALQLIDHLRYSLDTLPAPDARRRVMVLPLVRAVVRNLSVEFKRFNVAQKVSHIGLSTLPPLYLDPAMFQEILFNLLHNALKYNDRVTGYPRIWITGAEIQDWFAISVCDNGVGVPEQYADRIFERKFRAPQSKDPQGEGFGLWIVQRLVKLHGGLVQVTHFRKPTVFTIYLPKWLQKRPPKEREQ